MTISPIEWNRPSGVSRGLWEYLQDKGLARNYDASLAHASLFKADERFVSHFFEKPGHLLDLGCGTGRLLLPFARAGFWVLGVDLSEEMLRIVGEKAAAAGVSIHRLKANLVELDGLADQTFEYTTCLFSTLGMVSGQNFRRRVIDHAFRVLRPGGKFVLHVHNRWFNLRDPVGRRWLIRDLLWSWLTQAESGNRVMPVHQGIAGLTLHLFSRREVVRLVKLAGFRIVEVCPVSLRSDGLLPFPWLLPGLRAYGYLVAAQRPLI